MKFRLIGLVMAFLLLDVLLVWWWLNNWRERRYEHVIHVAADRYSVPRALVKAVIWRESRFDANARGTKQELGLMQIRKAAADEWAAAEKVKGFQVEHLLDPGTNTLVGTWYLGKMLKRYKHTDNPLPYALADYNAGRSNVLRWNKDVASTNSVEFLKRMDFPGTKLYIKVISERYGHYGGKELVRTAAR